MTVAIAIIAAVFVVLVASFAFMTVRIVPQARARNVERLGRYRKTLEPGMNVIIPLIDRLKPLIDLREQVVSFLGQPVITEDNLVVKIDTVLFFQVTDPRAADYEIVDYIGAIEQLTATMLRSVIGSMDLEQSLTSRDKINTMLRGVLDDASGKWGVRVTRVEIKAIDPPQSVKDAMEKQMRAEREKRAAILTAEGVRQSQVLTAQGDRQGTILRAEGDKQSAILRAEGQAQAISKVFQSIHEGDPDPKLLAYQYIQALPMIANGAGSSVWMIPNEVTSALRTFSSAFESATGGQPAAPAGNGPAAPAGTGPAVLAGLGMAMPGQGSAAVTSPSSAAVTGPDPAAPADPDAAELAGPDAVLADSDAAVPDGLGAATGAGLDAAQVDDLTVTVAGPDQAAFSVPGLPGIEVPSLPGIEVPSLPGIEVPSLPGIDVPGFPGMDVLGQPGSSGSGGPGASPRPPRPQVPGQARPTDLEA
jgi:regulator of protease activity HflC (stomatin/prohibitin superfamily)